MAAMYFPWWNACSNSNSVGCLDPSPANVPAPYGLPPFTFSISNIPAPNVYPIGTNIIPWWTSCVMAVNLHSKHVFQSLNTTSLSLWWGVVLDWEKKLTRWFLDRHLETRCCRRFQLAYRRVAESSRAHLLNLRRPWTEQPSASARSLGVIRGASRFGGALILESTSSGSVSGTCQQQTVSSMLSVYIKRQLVIRKKVRGENRCKSRKPPVRDIKSH